MHNIRRLKTFAFCVVAFSGNFLQIFYHLRSQIKVMFYCRQLTQFSNGYPCGKAIIWYEVRTFLEQLLCAYEIHFERTCVSVINDAKHFISNRRNFILIHFKNNNLREISTVIGSSHYGNSENNPLIQKFHV